MSYRLDARETLEQGIRRIVDEQLAAAVEGLRTASGDDRDEAVHGARKATKKSRAVLRLVRDELGSKTYKRENRALRDAARRLSEPRDAAVLAATVGRLAEQVPLARNSLAPLRSALEDRRREITTRVLDDEDAITFAAEEIDVVRRRVGDWRIKGNGFSALDDGLLSSYARGREAFAVARKEPTDERLHEARKDVKDLWYHARLLKPIWPGPMGELVDATDELGDLLGEDHDLAVLAATVHTLTAAQDAGSGETVLTLAANRRIELQERIWPLGRRVYADKPKPFVRRLAVLYRAWRVETVWRITPEGAEALREMLEARRTGTSNDRRRLRERLRRHGIRMSDLEERLPARNGELAPDDFDRLVKGGRVKVVEAKT